MNPCVFCGGFWHRIGVNAGAVATGFEQREAQCVFLGQKGADRGGPAIKTYGTRSVSTRRSSSLSAATISSPDRAFRCSQFHRGSEPSVLASGNGRKGTQHRKIGSHHLDDF